MCIQYIGGHYQYIGGISWVHRGMFSTSGGCSVHRGDVSTSGDVQYIGGISWYMWGSNLIKSFQLLLKTPMYWTSRCTKHLPMYSYPATCTMVSPTCNIPRCTHDIPPMYLWYPSNVLNITDVLNPSNVLNITRCTHGISPMYSWYPPDVLNIPRCTEHTLYRVVAVQ